MTLLQDEELFFQLRRERRTSLPFFVFLPCGMSDDDDDDDVKKKLNNSSIKTDLLPGRKIKVFSLLSEPGSRSELWF